MQTLIWYGINILEALLIFFQNQSKPINNTRLSPQIVFTLRSITPGYIAEITFKLSSQSSTFKISYLISKIYMHFLFAQKNGV